MKKAWKILHTPKQPFKSYKDILDALLMNRKIEDRDAFINPKLESVTIQSVGIDIEEIKKALKSIKETQQEGKSIVIYGDYDVDGICATAILWETIYKTYRNVHPYIPHRIDEGYGLSIKGIENLKKQIPNLGLIITVDNGIVATKAADFALKNKIKVIITDHHTRGKTKPKAEAIVHTIELCGTGIAHILSRELSKSNNTSHLELVALATVADLVPLNKNNRTLLKFGLKQLRNTRRVGLLELFEVAQIKKEEIDTYHIGHMIAPRLNASGRISHALDALRLICTTDRKRAKELADQLNKINMERQKMTLESSGHASLAIKSRKENLKNLVFVEHTSYEQGVIGLIASRMVEEFNRPSIVVSIGEKVSKGSARSISGVNIIELIRSCSEFLTEVGGHPMAAGFSIETQNLGKFKKAILKKAKEIDSKLFEKERKIDLELPFDLISEGLHSTVLQLAPFGMGNPEPVFATHAVTLASIRKVGKEGQHLQTIFQKDGSVFKGIVFRFDSDNLKTGDILDIVYKVDRRVWEGKTKIELKLKDLSYAY